MTAKFTKRGFSIMTSTLTEKMKKCFFRDLTRRRVFVTIGLLIIFSISPAFADDMLLQSPDIDTDWVFDSDSDEITDKTLEQFGMAIIAIQQVQQQANDFIENTIDDSPLTEERFIEIYTMQANDPETVSESFKQEDIAAFSATMEEITTIQTSAQQEMVVSVQDSGFEVEDFNELSVTIQEDPELLTRLEKLFGPQE
jgi:hypothetical protein